MKSINFLNYFKRVYRKKTLFLSFSNSSSCPCYLTYCTIKKNGFPKSLNVTRVDELKIINKTKGLKNLIVYVHGDKKNLNFYLRCDSGEINKLRIENQLWEIFKDIDGVTYFHSCYGAEILQHINNTNKNPIKKWVSYSDEVYNLYHSNVEVMNLFNKLQIRICDIVSMNKSPLSLYESIKSIHYELKSDLMDIKNNNGKIKHRFIIQYIGRNIKRLKSSEKL